MPGDIEAVAQLEIEDCEDDDMLSMHVNEEEEDESVGKRRNEMSEESEQAGSTKRGKRDEGMGTAMNEEEEEDVDSFIRIRSRNDGIFEQEEDEEDDEEFFEFTIPEVEMRCPATRKRKQEINLLDNAQMDIIEVTEDDEHIYNDHEPVYQFDPELLQPRKRDRLPLYLLNPDDYAHDPKKQIQIRRAIITYRHHQDKKEQIIKLTEENKKLRDHTDALKVKVIELSRCGCEKNKTANLSVLDVKIPQVPPRMYIRGNRQVLGVPYNKTQLSPTSFSKMSSEAVKVEEEEQGSQLPSTSSSATTKPVPPLAKIVPASTEAPKPLINITSSRLASLSCKTMNATNVTSTPSHKSAATKVDTPFGKAAVTSPNIVRGRAKFGTPLQSLQMAPNANRVSISGMTVNRPGFIPISMATAVKHEPGVVGTSMMSITNTKMPGPSTTFTPLTANVKTEDTTPATATPASRIVFAKKGNTAKAVQTASQLLFGNRTTLIPQSSNSRGSSEIKLPLTASQLTFGTRAQRPGIVANPLNSLNNTAVPGGQVFKTPTGQVLKLVQASPVTRKVPKPFKFTPILPKPSVDPLTDLDSEMLKRQRSKEQLEEMWRQFDNDDEDEMAIIAAINGTSPPQPQRSRKQTVGHLNESPTERLRRNKVFLKSNGEEIELTRYRDVVIEEAD